MPISTSLSFKTLLCLLLFLGGIRLTTASTYAASMLSVTREQKKDFRAFEDSVQKYKSSVVVQASKPADTKKQTGARVLMGVLGVGLSASLLALGFWGAIITIFGPVWPLLLGLLAGVYVASFAISMVEMAISKQDPDESEPNIWKRLFSRDNFRKIARNGTKLLLIMMGVGLLQLLLLFVFNLE